MKNKSLFQVLKELPDEVLTGYGGIRYVEITPYQAKNLQELGCQVYAFDARPGKNDFQEVGRGFLGRLMEGTLSSDMVPKFLAIRAELKELVNQKSLEIPVHNGTMVVGLCQDPENPGVYAGYRTSAGQYFDLFTAETKENSPDVTMYTFADPGMEDYTDKQTIAYEYIMAATAEPDSQDGKEIFYPDKSNCDDGEYDDL
jgi:hypothetical protein